MRNNTKGAKRYFKILLLLGLLLTALLFSGCSRKAGPVKINDLSFYNPEFGEDNLKMKMYLSWTNTEKDMTADSLELVLKGKFGGGSEGEESIRYRISLKDGLLPGESLSSVYDVEGLLSGRKYTVSVSRVSFTDGTVWSAKKPVRVGSAAVDGRKGKGMPASLEECNYYEQREGAVFRDLNALWINKGKKPLRGVVYELLAYDAEGNRVKNWEGYEKTVYMPAYDEELTQPGSIQSLYHLRLDRLSSYIDESAYLEVRIVKAIAEDGTVYTASKGGSLKAYFGSKKAYNFGNETSGAVKRLGNKVRSALKKYDIKESKPQIYIREGDFALLRFDDIDLRVELTEKGKVSPYTVSIVKYYTRGEFIDQIVEGVSVREMNVAKAVLPCVLKKIKKNEILEKVDEFYHNDKAYIDFGDRSYDTFDDFSTIFSEDGGRLICEVLGVGIDFDYYPLNALFWGYDSIYESDRVKTVPKRP